MKADAIALLVKLVDLGVTPNEAHGAMHRIIRERQGVCAECEGYGCTECCHTGEERVRRICNEAEAEAVRDGELKRCPCGLLTHVSEMKGKSPKCRGCSAPVTRSRSSA